MAIHLRPKPVKRAALCPAVAPPPAEEYHPPTREVVAGNKPKLRKLRKLFRKREL